MAPCIVRPKADSHTLTTPKKDEHMLKSSSLIAAATVLCTATLAQADSVEIYLIDTLDNTQAGYCIDIAGGKGAQADPADGLQAHTCYSPLGGILVDQTFDTERFADQTLYMPEFDVCMEIDTVDAGASVQLSTCDDSEAQAFVFSGEGLITPASAPNMCLTAGEDTRSGRSSTNQIKTLTLETCSDAQAAYQTWSVRAD